MGSRKRVLAHENMRGTTLVELTVASFILSLVLITVFLLFGMGSRGFQAINERQDAQSQLSAIRSVIQFDLQQTHFFGVFTREALPVTAGSETIRRDGLSCVTLDSWQSPTNFSVAGLPQWNRWVVYRVTHEESGQLLRHLIMPNTTETGLALLKEAPLLPAAINDSNPTRTGWSDVMESRNIAQNIRDFRIRLDQDAHSIAIKVVIRKESTNPRSKNEEIAANFYIQPHNTGPGD